MRKRGKKLLSLLLALCMTAGAGMPYLRSAQVNAADVDINDGLRGYWKFDGTETDALKNQAADSAYTASIEGSGVELSADSGVSGGSVHFKQEANSDLKLDMKSEFNVAENPFTLMVWVKYDETMSFTDTPKLFQQDGSGYTMLYLNSSKRYVEHIDQGNSVFDKAIQLGSWHHVAFTNDPETKKIELYIDGTLVSSKTADSSKYYNGGTNIYVGIHKNKGKDTAIKGDVDELRYYNKVVNGDTVKAIYDVYGAGMELRERKQELSDLITEAGDLKKGTAAAKEALQSAITSAQGVLDKENSTVDELSKAIESLNAAMTAYRNSAPVEIAVDTKTELRQIPDAMYGINHRYHNDGYGSWNATENKVEEVFDTYAKEASFGSVRYPGGTVGNCFEWKRAIGPKEERKKTVPGNVFYTQASEPLVDPNFGVDEAMTWIYDELHAEAIWMYGMGQGSAADAADLVEYLNAPNDGSNPGGGTDWAAERAKNGHEEPYGVTRFEIGNEYGDTGQTYWLDGCTGDRLTAYIQGGDMTFNANTGIYMGHKGNAVTKEEDWSPQASNGDGTKNQKRYIRYVPVVEGSVTVKVDGEQWEIVDTLEGKGAQNVCTLDYATGELAFGDGVDGNIPQNGKPITADYTTHQDGFVQYYDAMKAIADEIGIDIQIYSGYADWGQENFINKMHALSGDDQDKYDGVIFHPYIGNPGSSENDPDYYEKALVRSKANPSTGAQNLLTKARSVSGDNTKKVAVSEFGINYNSNDKLETMIPAMYIANLLIDYTKMGVEYTNKHCLVDFLSSNGGRDSLGAVMQCVIQAWPQNDGSCQFVSTPAAKMFTIFNNMTGDTLVSETVENNDTYYDASVPTVCVMSTKDDYGNTYVTLLNNKKEESRDVVISVDGRDLSGTEAEVWYLAPESVNDKNTLENPDNVVVKKETVSCDAETLEYTLAPHSVTSFKIPLQVTVTAEKGGTVSGGKKVEIGESVTVTATPDEGYEFAGWYKGSEKVSDEATYTFTVQESVALTAKFTKKEDPGNENPGQQQPLPGGVASNSVKSSASANGAELTWPKVSGADGYTVERRTSPNGAWEVVSDSTGSSYKDSTVKAGSTYYYRIRAYKTVAGKKVYFANAAEQTVQTKMPAKPVKFKAKKTKKGIKLTWKRSAGADGYIIYRSYNKKKGFKKIATIKKGAQTSYLYKKARKGKVAYYKMKAYVNVGGQKKLTQYSKRIKKKG